MNATLKRTLVPLAASVAAGCFAVAVDLHNDEVQAAALVLLVAGFGLGAIWPAGAWRWALILGVSIFVGDPIGLWLGSRPPWPATGMNYGSLVAVVPAFIGTYVGVGVRRLLSASASSL